MITKAQQAKPSYPCLLTAALALGLSLPVAASLAADAPAAPKALQLSAEQQKNAGIEMATAGAGIIRQSVTAPGKIVINADRIAHVIPRVTGVVREVRKSTGDSVIEGELMAVIESMEIADARAAYFSAAARKKLAEATFKRKQMLWQEQIVSQQSFEEARQAMELAEVEEHSAAQKLVAMDMPLKQVKKQGQQPGLGLSRYEIRAPFSGQILERDMVLGEATQPNIPVFVLGNLESVWVDLSVYPKDLDRISIGESVMISGGGKTAEALAKVIYVRPVVSEESRATTVRAILTNQDHRWQPGLFVNGEIVTDQLTVPVAVARSGLLNLHNQTVVFVQEGDALVPRPVVTGKSDHQLIEIVEGLNAGERYVSAGVFVL